MNHILNQIFSSLVFTKVKTVESFSLYFARLESSTLDGIRYVILAVPFNRATRPRVNIGEVDWVSLQTRILTVDYPIEEQVLDYKALDSRYPYGVGVEGDGKIKLVLKSRDAQNTEYMVMNDSLPIEVVLLHDPKKKSIYQYADSMELRQALSTFQCVLKKV